jgi:hypothetical protein
MSMKYFDNLQELIKEEIKADANVIRYCISPEEKLIYIYISQGAR